MDKYIVNITLLGRRERLPRRHLLLGTAGEACFVLTMDWCIFRFRER